ncbi:helix-turn-helix domain-containing protein [Curtobacterium sp. ME12]|uniref:helix-turn-helix domain-containing protein n=1 Tax=Curtobacterium sp. ME12 TaxID=2744253 RepID=UPI0015F57CCF|nr:helix-turn-helix domain-containing protein [Curtobacterium sp. ME12]
MSTERTSDDAVVRLAKRSIDENPCRSIDAATLAILVGLTIGELRRILLDRQGMTPARFVLHHRLDRVREALLAGQEIAVAANAWGFVHRGRFGEAYLKQHLQLPEETVASARKNHLPE